MKKKLGVLTIGVVVITGLSICYSSCKKEGVKNVAASLELISGGNQKVEIGTALADPIEVMVKDQDGNPFAGATINFAVTEGTVSNASVTTGANGTASVTWTLGATAGTQTLTITAFGTNGTTPLSGSPCIVSATKMPDNGLLAYYRFDNNAVDASGNGYDGVANNVISSDDRNNSPDGSYEFNGLDASVVTSTEIDNYLGEGASFSAWIYYTGESTGRIISNYNGTGTGGNCNERIGFVFGVTSDRGLNIFYAIDGDDYIGRRSAADEIALDTWYHVACVWDGTFTAEGFKLYINGVQKDVENLLNGSVDCGYLESLNPFLIGMGHCAAGECAPFKGRIDDVRIYERALTELEIEALAGE